MISRLLMPLVAAGLLWVGPVQAHGEEKHGDAATTAESSQTSAAHDADTVLSVDPETLRSDAGSHDKAAQDPVEADTGLITVLATLHPATIHFPIALFLMAAVTELFVIAGRGKGLEPAVRVLIYGGAVGAVVAALFGWLHTGLWLGGDTVMQIHRWTGMFIAFLGMAMAFLASRPQESRTLLRSAIFSMAVLVIAQGFLGGELAHGPDHLEIPWL